MRRCGRPHQIEKAVRARCPVSWGSWYWENSSCTRGISGTGKQGPLLSYRRQRGLLDGSEEDRGPDGEFQESNW